MFDRNINKVKLLNYFSYEKFSRFNRIGYVRHDSICNLPVFQSATAL
jgi:hypothetical protein